MNQLVIQQNGNPVTTSRLVAEKFGKRHSDVIRRVKGINCTKDFTERNFALSEYEDPTGRMLPEYVMTKNGFMFLAMGFTGKEADRLKEQFINEFDRRGEALKEAQLMIAQYSNDVTAKLEAMSRQLTAIEAANLQSPTYTTILPEIEGYATIKQFVEEIDFPITSGENMKVRNACIQICRKNNMEVKTWEDETTGYKHTFFPKSALHKAVSTVFNI